MVFDINSLANNGAKKWRETTFSISSALRREKSCLKVAPFFLSFFPLSLNFKRKEALPWEEKLNTRKRHKIKCKQRPGHVVAASNYLGKDKTLRLTEV